MFYRYPQRHAILGLNVHGLQPIALVHTAGAFLLVTFLVAHLYLVTTGHTLTSNLKAMITGYEELESDMPSRESAAPDAALAASK